MNKQRKILMTITYNELGIIVDTKAEELDLSAQPNLQPTCNNLAIDTISRQAAIDDLHGKDPSQIWDTADVEVWVNALPSAQPEIIYCKDCKYHHRDNSGAYYCERKEYGYGWGLNDFCSDAERRTDE